MNPRLPGSCLRAVLTVHHAHARQILLRHAQPFLTRRASSTLPPEDWRKDLTRPEKSALLAVQCRGEADRINPARSTLPATLHLPTRDLSSNVLIHWVRLGRSYAKFYVSGVKAVWFNYKAVQTLKKLEAGNNNKALPLPGTSPIGVAISRAEYQLIHRNRHDIGKLPFFGLLVAVFGEWLPLLVPFMPSVVPGTCRIPKQVAQMRERVEKRRSISFRQGISEPSSEQMPVLSAHAKYSTNGLPWALMDPTYGNALLSQLRDDQLHHLSSTLNLHSSLWDRVQQRPPSFFLRRIVSKRLAYLTGDDFLLDRDGGVSKLSLTELEIACELRGINVQGRDPSKLQSELALWLTQQKDDKGRGKAVLTMLFRRPNAWESDAGKRRE